MPHWIQGSSSVIKTALADTIASVQSSDGGIFLVSKVHGLLTKMHDILDNSVSKWAGNTACVLADLFNSASRQHHEVLTSL